MGRKKKKPIKPWCWYCNREFDDDKILIQHQRAKHYKCPFCHKKLYSGPGLTVHCVQVHKEKLDKIPEALPNRNSVDIDIYGMQGIPEDDLREHERLKRGDDGQSKSSEQDTRIQANKMPTSNQHHLLPPHHLPPPPMGMPPNSMHAAMFQHAMSMGMMPPGFSKPPPGMPPMTLPPGFMPPPGFPGMLPPPPMHPGMPPPPMNFPGMMPPAGSLTFPPPPMGGYAPPPPPPPPPGEPSTSGNVPPPPMSGVGLLIGVPPPNFDLSGPPPIRPQGTDSQSESTATREYNREQSDTYRSQVNQQDLVDHQATSSSSLPAAESSSNSPKPTASTIAKPALIASSSETSNHLGPLNYIDVPSAKVRIMHPHRDLSIEELRLGLSKYKEMMQARKEDKVN